MLDQKKINWIKLSLISEISPARGKKLLARFLGPGQILAADIADIASVVGEKPARIIDQQRKSIDLDEQLRLIDKYRVSLIALDDPDYPANLKNIFNPPLVLFIRGQGLLEQELLVAIVGTRMATSYGINMSRKISGQLVERGFTVISGGARGIDTAAHFGALAGKGRTIAVLGCGVDVAYPAENARLFEQIASNGAVISEYPMGTRPRRQNFPCRNRIVSGLSVGVVVIEAPLKSGALITASCALEQGREVFCVPGEADSFNSKGSHQLLREGAKLVEGADDIIEEIEPIIRNFCKI